MLGRSVKKKSIKSRDCDCSFLLPGLEEPDSQPTNKVDVFLEVDDGSST